MKRSASPPVVGQVDDRRKTPCARPMPLSLFLLWIPNGRGRVPFKQADVIQTHSWDCGPPLPPVGRPGQCAIRGGPNTRDPAPVSSFRSGVFHPARGCAPHGLLRIRPCVGRRYEPPAPVLGTPSLHHFSATEPLTVSSSISLHPVAPAVSRNAQMLPAIRQGGMANEGEARCGQSTAVAVYPGRLRRLPSPARRAPRRPSVRGLELPFYQFPPRQKLSSPSASSIETDHHTPAPVR